jgi:hypothetical protein
MLICSAWIKYQVVDIPSVFVTSNGAISFTSDAPLELISAQSNSLYGVIDIKDKKLAFSVNIRTFEGFNSALQREHFQEKYLESRRFPKATFSGKIIYNESLDNFGIYKVRAKGMLNIHGVEKERIVNGVLNINKNQLLLDAHMLVPLQDHEISVPTIVSKKIAENIDVRISAKLVPKTEIR